MTGHALNYDVLWQRILAEIPSKWFDTPLLRNELTGCRKGLARIVGWRGDRGGLQYLEIGCRLGHSLAVVAGVAGNRLEGASVVDLWIPDYAGEPNPGREAVRAHLSNIGIRLDAIAFPSGDSHVMLPYLYDLDYRYDLIHVDGDHTPEGALQDLEDSYRLLLPGGYIVFDDAVPELLNVWRRFIAAHRDLTAVEHLDEPAGVPPWCEAQRSVNSSTPSPR